MTNNSRFRDIEGDEFAARIAFASTSEAVDASFKNAPDLLALVQNDDDDVELRVLQRIYELCHREPDRRWENPYDAALAAYYWLLNRRSSPFTAAAESLISGQVNLFWADRLVRLLRARARRDAVQTEVEWLRSPIAVRILATARDVEYLAASFAEGDLRAISGYRVEMTSGAGHSRSGWRRFLELPHPPRLTGETETWDPGFEVVRT